MSQEAPCLAPTLTYSIREVQRQGMYQLAWGEAVHFFFSKDSSPLGTLFRLLKVFSTVGVNIS